MNNIQIDDAKYIDVVPIYSLIIDVMPIYSLIIEYVYAFDYSKTSRSLCQFYRGKPFLDPNGANTNFLAASNNSTFI